MLQAAWDTTVCQTRRHLFYTPLLKIACTRLSITHLHSGAMRKSIPAEMTALALCLLWPASCCNTFAASSCRSWSAEVSNATSEGKTPAGSSMCHGRCACCAGCGACCSSGVRRQPHATGAFALAMNILSYLSRSDALHNPAATQYRCEM